MKIEVLDHGYVSLIENWGSDARIIEAARMSTNKGFLGWGPKCEVCGALEGDSGWCSITNPKSKVGDASHTFKPGDEKLLRFLYENNHHTPFEMAGMTIEVQAPIFVFREWHRHRTQSYNELSARYTPLPDVNYLPDSQVVWRRANTVTANKQAQGTSDVGVPLAQIKEWLGELQQVYAMAQAVYQKGLDIGIPKELARLPVPVARYSRMRASANLRNWLGFLTLRSAPTAQEEIMLFSDAVSGIVKQSFPKTFELFQERFSRVTGKMLA